MSNKLLSVIVPMYNVEKYLDNCINSIVNQTYKNLEIILIDDGSTDDSLSIANRWIEIDKRIMVYHKDNGGLSSARNYGLDRIHGEFITFVDSDDSICLKMYEEMMSAFEENVDLVCCGINRVDKDGKLITKMSFSPNVTEFSPNQAMYEILAGNNINVAVYNKIYRAHLFCEPGDIIRFPLGQTMEDAAIMPYILKKCSRIIQIPYVGYNYYENAMSITTKPLCHEIYYVYDTISNYEHNFKSMYPELLKYVKIYRIRNSLYLYRTAVLQKKIIKKEVYQRAKTEFYAVLISGLLNPKISLREKAMLIETFTHLHVLRKKNK